MRGAGARGAAAGPAAAAGGVGRGPVALVGRGEGLVQALKFGRAEAGQADESAGLGAKQFQAQHGSPSSCNLGNLPADGYCATTLLYGPAAAPGKRPWGRIITTGSGHQQPPPMDTIYLDHNATTPVLPTVWEAMR